MPAKRTFRLYPDVNTPFSSEKEELDFQRGHQWGLGGGTAFQLVAGLKLSGEYEYSGQFSNSVSGGRKAGYDYSILTADSDSSAHTFTAGLSFSTVALFMKKQFLLPLQVGLNYSKVLSGKNTDVVEMTYLHVEAYF